MLRFEDVAKALDKDIRVEVYDKIGNLIHNGKLRDLKVMPENIIRITPQSTSREIFLEIYTY